MWNDSNFIKGSIALNFILLSWVIVMKISDGVFIPFEKDQPVESEEIGIGSNRQVCHENCVVKRSIDDLNEKPCRNERERNDIAIPIAVSLDRASRLVPEAINSVDFNIFISNVKLVTLMSFNFLGAASGAARAVYQQMEIYEKRDNMKIKDFNREWHANNIQFVAQLAYGYGYWGQYKDLEWNLSSWVKCSLNDMNMVLEEYKEVTNYKNSNMNPTLSAVLCFEINEKMKKKFYDLISRKSEKSENPVVKDLIAQIKIFTDLLSENTCA